MLWRMIVPALASMAFVHGAAWARSTATDDVDQTLPQKIRDKLTAEGFKDVNFAAPDIRQDDLIRQ